MRFYVVHGLKSTVYVKYKIYVETKSSQSNSK